MKLEAGTQIVLHKSSDNLRGLKVGSCGTVINFFCSFVVANRDACYVKWDDDEDGLIRPLNHKDVECISIKKLSSTQDEHKPKKRQREDHKLAKVEDKKLKSEKSVK